MLLIAVATVSTVIDSDDRLGHGRYAQHMACGQSILCVHTGAHTSAGRLEDISAESTSVRPGGKDRPMPAAVMKAVRRTLPMLDTASF
jgi:hypothetical protein